MKRFTATFFFALLCLFGIFGSAQDKPLRTMDEIKTWHLQSDGSRVDVKLSSYAHAGKPYSTSVSFALSEKGHILTVGQIAELLSQILKEMPELGYAPERIENVVFASWDSDLEFGVTSAVVKSGQWRNCIGRKCCWSVQHVIDDYLRSADVLRPLESILETHHLNQGMISIDEPSCGLVSRSTPRSVEVGAQSLSCSGLIHVFPGFQSH